MYFASACLCCSSSLTSALAYADNGGYYVEPATPGDRADYQGATTVRFRSGSCRCGSSMTYLSGAIGALFVAIKLVPVRFSQAEKKAGEPEPGIGLPADPPQPRVHGDRHLEARSDERREREVPRRPATGRAADRAGEDRQVQAAVPQLRAPMTTGRSPSSPRCTSGPTGPSCS